MTDIGVPSHNSNSVAILKNTSNTPGTLSFSARSWDYGVGDGPYRIAAGDLNGDGKRDLATANRLGNSVTILINRVVGARLISSPGGTI
ncbi:MAG: VCBS repeat-containing protein [Acidobacteria bacterium]|nr:VCBS repeat-containing protein [Acidobacteriota bacterium]